MILWFWLMSMVVWAGEMEFGYAPSLGAGEQPMFSVTVPREVSTLWVQVEAGGKTWEFQRAQMAAGEQLQVRWDRNPSVTEALATVRCEFSDGYVEAVQVPVSYSYAGRLEVDLSQASADVERRVLSVAVNQPIVRAEVTALGARKAILDSRTIDVQAGPGTVEIPWIGDPSEVVLLDVTLHTANAWSGFTYSPWFLDIPHDDVVFATGSWEIVVSEEPKLHHLKKELESVVEKYGSMVPVKLYIGGCTDTVGTAESNRSLSRERARSIGAWLASNGIAIPIYYFGFGEGWLAESTGDGVDNEANRRAIYMVGANPPPLSAGVPSARWLRL